MAISVRFEDNTAIVTGQIDNLAESALYEVAGEIVSQTIRNSDSHAASGQTKNSYEYIVDTNDDESTATIGSNFENAIWEEFGTGEYALEGNGRKGAWYVPVDGYSGKKRPTYNGQVVVVYGKDGKQFYKTNGKKPRRPLFKAFEVKKNWAIRHIQEKFREGLS